MTLERCREVDSSFSGRVTQEQFDQVCKISYLFIASSLWRRMEERGCRGCGSGQFFIRRRYLGDFSLISSAGCFLKVLANESQCRNLCFWGYRYCGICWFFFLWCYGICIVFWLYCSIQHLTHPQWPHSGGKKNVERLLRISLMVPFLRLYVSVKRNVKLTNQSVNYKSMAQSNSRWF